MIPATRRRIIIDDQEVTVYTQNEYVLHVQGDLYFHFEGLPCRLIDLQTLRIGATDYRQVSFATCWLIDPEAPEELPAASCTTPKSLTA